LESADGDDLSLDVLSVDEDALVVEDVDDGGELALEGTVVDPGDATDLHELAVTLHKCISTIVVVKYIYYLILKLTTSAQRDPRGGGGR
jgi:hypothetical protein